MTTYELRTPRGKRPFMVYDSEHRAREDWPRAEKAIRGPLELVRVVTRREEEVLN